MPVTQPSNPRKRRHSELLTPQQNKASQRTSKRQKRSHPPRSQFPLAFWDNLSKIDLTKRALEELDRRNTPTTPNVRVPVLLSRRPTTRYLLAELKKSFQPLSSPVEYLCHCGASGLKRIKLTARRGGPDLLDLRGFPPPPSLPKPAMSLSRSTSRVSDRRTTSTPRTKPSTNSTNTASTGPYNRNFQQHLIDNGVYPDGYEFPDGRVPELPANWEEVNKRLAQPRRSLSPSKFSDEEFRKFKRADAHAAKEKQVTTYVIPIIEGDIGDAKCVAGGIPFTNLDHLTNGTLVPGNPDIYYGARPEQLDRRVRDELSGHIIPTTQDDLPIAPNFFLAAKGPDGSLAVAGRQASYDGTLGERGMDSLKSYGRREPIFANTASTISSIYHGGQLKMFTIHLSQPASSGSRPEYQMHQLNTWGMTGNIESFRQGATYYRNGRDWAKEQRDEAIRQANGRVEEGRAGPFAISATITQDTSFENEATSDGPRTIKALTEQSRSSLTEESNTTIHLHTSEPSSSDLLADYQASVKRSRPLSHGTVQSQQKRQNASDSDYELAQQLELQLSEHSGLSQKFEVQALEQEPASPSTDSELRPITRDPLAQPAKPVPRRNSGNI